MNKKTRYLLISSFALLLLFVLLIIGIKLFDVSPIGPLESEIGFSELNAYVHDLFGYNELWYELTEPTIYVALLSAAAFAFLGLIQLIKRKSIFKVDTELYILATLYVAVVGSFVLFELFVVNLRPVLTDGELEASFPSTHTMLVICMIGSAIHYINHKFKHKAINITATVLGTFLISFSWIGRLLSGVHWFTDILGGLLISFSLLLAYMALYEFWLSKKKQ